MYWYNDRKIKTKRKAPRLPYAIVSQSFHSQSARWYYKQRPLRIHCGILRANYFDAVHRRTEKKIYIFITRPSSSKHVPVNTSWHIDIMPYLMCGGLEFFTGQKGWEPLNLTNNVGKGKKLRSYIARYPVHRTAQSALHFTPWQTCSFQGHLNFFGKYSATLQLLREGYSFTYPPLSVLPGTHLYSWVNCGNVGDQTCQRWDLKPGSLGWESGLLTGMLSRPTP